MLAELKWVCADRRKHIKFKFEKVKPFDVVASIKAKIEDLAAKEKLLSLETELKSEFNKVFQPIPHIDELPMSETARIQLKDEYKKIALRTYACLRQFRDSFAKLIKLRLDSGFIRPSASSFASPSFIIPKADKNALPQWS